MKALLTGLAVALHLAAFTPQSANAQAAPNRTRIVYGYPAGDAADTLVRLLAEKMQAELKHPFIVENIGGAAGRIGTKAVINSPGDGGSLLYSPMAPVTLHPLTTPNLDYDPFKQLKPVSQIVKFDIALGVGAHVPVRNLKELVGWVRENPGKASYGVPGAGGLPNFFATMFSTAANVKIEKIPYRGTAPALNDMVAGHLPFALSTTGQMVELHKLGKIRILATSSTERSPFTPDVPTFRESGYDIIGEGWFGMFAPASMADAMVENYSAAIRKILQKPDVRQQILSWAFVPTGTTPQELREIQRADFSRWEPAIRASGFVAK